MILTMTKYHENLLSNCPLSLLFIVKFFSSLESKMVLKIPNKPFLRIIQNSFNQTSSIEDMQSADMVVFALNVLYKVQSLPTNPVRRFAHFVVAWPANTDPQVRKNNEEAKQTDGRTDQWTVQQTDRQPDRPSNRCINCTLRQQMKMKPLL